MENHMEVPQKIQNRQPCDPANPLLNIYPREMKSQSRRDVFTPVFTAALFTIAKARKQPKCP